MQVFGILSNRGHFKLSSPDSPVRGTVQHSLILCRQQATSGCTQDVLPSRYEEWQAPCPDIEAASPLDAFQVVDRLIVTQVQALLDRRAPDRPEEGFPRIAVGFRLKAAPPPNNLLGLSLSHRFYNQTCQLLCTSPFLCCCFCFALLG